MFCFSWNWSGIELRVDEEGEGVEFREKEGNVDSSWIAEVQVWETRFSVGLEFIPDSAQLRRDSLLQMSDVWYYLQNVRLRSLNAVVCISSVFPSQLTLRCRPIRTLAGRSSSPIAPSYPLATR